jgi:hypothetical protein
LTLRRPASYPRRDPFHVLEPAGVESLRVAWSALRVPGPPASYALTPDEIGHPEPAVRFARRTVQTLSCVAPHGCDTLALVDKAAPHALNDLMLTEVSPGPGIKSTALDVSPATGRILWRTGANFVRFCADPEVIRAFGLDGGELRLALNCDPNTWDRESVQAAKQFHLHLLYWTRAELAPLAGAARLGARADPRVRRQALDPVSFLAGRLLTEALAGLEPGIPGSRVLPPDDDAILRGERPFGWVVALPGWEVLETPAFERLVRGVHLGLTGLAARLGETFTGHPEPPPPWTRHPLLPPDRLRERIAALDYSERVRAGLGQLAEVLHDLPPRCARRLARGPAATRMHLMTLNQPSYALALHAASPEWSACPVWLSVQPRLFSGIGGAGLLSLAGVPSVRVLRGQGAFGDDQWRARARFQHAFACFNQARLEGTEPGLKIRDPSRFAGPDQGWVPG